MPASLPMINEKINSKAAEVQQSLDALPKPPEGNISLHVQTKVLDFQRSLQSHMDGGSLDHPFFTQWHDEAKSFRNKVVLSHPRLKLGGMARGTPVKLGATPGPCARDSPVSPSVGAKRGAADSEPIDVDMEDGAPSTPQREKKRAKLSGHTPVALRFKLPDSPEASEASRTFLMTPRSFAMELTLTLQSLRSDSTLEIFAASSTPSTRVFPALVIHV